MSTEAILESLLFISGEPISFKRLSKLTSINEGELELSCGELAKKYNDENRGLRILIKSGKAQMVTAGENSEFVGKFFKADIEGELSKAALEVLSVVAYRGPVTRSKIEDIRGVNCSFTLRHLLIRGLVERIDNPSDARAYLYRISFDFLRKLGVEKVEDLPKYDELKLKKVLEEELKERMEMEENGSRENQTKEGDEEEKEDSEESGPSEINAIDNADDQTEKSDEREIII
jgi:segregation and condensation protein B